jgi:hypothetical protein
MVLPNGWALCPKIDHGGQVGPFRRYTTERDPEPAPQDRTATQIIVRHS